VLLASFSTLFCLLDDYTIMDREGVVQYSTMILLLPVLVLPVLLQYPRMPLLPLYDRLVCLCAWSRSNALSSDSDGIHSIVHRIVLYGMMMMQ
jgi:hypothetical protein